MKPTETWRKNNWRFDLRKYTRVFEQKFKEKKDKNLTEVGKVYAISYKTSSDFLTDKHHVTPIIVSFGRFRDDEGLTYVRGLNLLFLKPHQSLEILEDMHAIKAKKPNDIASAMIKLHEKYIRIYPYLFKNFEEKRILTQSEVIREDWGMIPLLKKELWGIFNGIALNEDFQLETTVTRKEVKRRPKKLQEEQKDEEQESYYEDQYLNDEGLVDLETDI
jgi:hypothetical protein